MKYLSFSLWGNLPIYNVGAIRNAELWKTIYPKWEMVVFYDKTVPLDTIIKLKELGVNVIDMTNSNIYGEFWRFLIAEEKNCEYSIFRDCDSRIDLREKLAVDEWIESGKTLHIMRDHPYHHIPAGNNQKGILAGMWGIKGSIKDFKSDIISFQNETPYFYGIDQKYLKKVYENYIDDNCTHDEFFEQKPFPIKREKGVFVGGRIDENDNPVGNDHLILLKYDN